MKYLVYTMSEVAPNEFASTLYAEFDNDEQAYETAHELRSCGMSATVITAEQGKE